MSLVDLFYAPLNDRLNWRTEIIPFNNTCTPWRRAVGAVSNRYITVPSNVNIDLCLLGRGRWIQESQDLTMKASVEQMAAIRFVEELRAGCRSRHFRQISDLDTDVR